MFRLFFCNNLHQNYLLFLNLSQHSQQQPMRLHKTRPCLHILLIEYTNMQDLHHTHFDDQLMFPFPKLPTFVYVKLLAYSYKHTIAQNIFLLTNTYYSSPRTTLYSLKLLSHVHYKHKSSCQLITHMKAHTFLTTPLSSPCQCQPISGLMCE